MSVTPPKEINNSLIKKIKYGDVGLALMVKQARTVDIAIAAQTCGFDAVYLDMQHNNMSADTAAQISVTALNTGITSLVRIPRNDYTLALRMLDAGALGIIFPDITTPEEAQAAVNHCKFAPLGRRSTTAIWPHFGYQSIPVAEAQKALNDNTLVIAMIETRTGLENVEAIAATKGLDIVHVGAGDLASDLGYPGQLHHPAVAKAMDRMAAACRTHGKIFGIGGLSGGSDADFEAIMRLGSKFITAANEWSLMISAGTDRVNYLRYSLKGAGTIGKTS